MKFKDIKVGDTVYVEITVSYGWRSGKTFFVPKKVTKVTATQFVVESGHRFKKDRGSEIGEHRCYAYNLGDTPVYMSSPVSDQTSEMIAFKSKLSKERKIKSMFENLKMEPDSKFSVQELDSIISKVTEINQILGIND